ncbi:PilZ domain-containing protein [Paenibacillus harenae]|uniref:PilZ domain-containing protein n=1 Tax=Paenibacillus harenae TaxID=306543 RepID=UPI0003FBFA9B|nr:PilZ domain-containing protein [Paenibacillus harenae]
MSTYLYKDARAHIRLGFTEGAKAELRLAGVNGHLLTQATKTVQLLDMSPSGLCFVSELQLPVQSNYLVELRMVLSNIHIHVQGRIVWRRSHDKQFAHGVIFECSDTLRSFIIGAMNQLLLDRQPEQQRIHYVYNRMSPLKRKKFGG